MRLGKECGLRWSGIVRCNKDVRSPTCWLTLVRQPYQRRSAQIQALGPSVAARLVELSGDRIESAVTLQPEDRNWVKAVVSVALQPCQGVGPKAALRALMWLAETE
eukprot:SAG11_NODE_4767_length_1775_cov_2.899165_2_plen_106_part_00